MPTIAAPRLRELALTIVRAMGSREEEARDVADHLAGANLGGHDSHGIGMLPDYVRMLHAGLLVPNQELRPVSDRGRRPGPRRGPRLRAADGEGGDAPGCRAGQAPGVRRGGAAQRLPHRPDRDLGRAVRGAGPGLRPLRQRRRPRPAPGALRLQRRAARHRPVLRRPAGGQGGASVLLDMATSAIAFGKARVARNKGVPVPPDSVIDGHGAADDRPAAAGRPARGRAAARSAATRAPASPSCASSWAPP